MTADDVENSLSDVHAEVKQAIRGCLRGLQHRRRQPVLAGPGLRCSPTTLRQWRSALGDSGLLEVCQAFDEAVVDLLAVRALPVKEVGRRLPVLAEHVVDANDLVQELVAELGRFEPPDAGRESALASAEVGRITHGIVTSVFESLAEGSQHPAWQSTLGLLRRRDDLLRRCWPEMEDEDDDELRYERALGLSSAKMNAGDGLTMASRTAAAWADQAEALDFRLYRQLPHLLDPSVPLSDKVRLHLVQLSVSERPFIAHRAAVAARGLVLRALTADASSCLATLAQAADHEPIMYFTHRGLVEGVRAFNQATDPRDRLRPAVQMYNSVVEGDVRRVARVVLRLLGRTVGDNATIKVLPDQLAPEGHEPIVCLITACVDRQWRNAIAHERVWWNSEQQRAVVGDDLIEPDLIAETALRARELCAGFETGVAVALNEAGNPQDRGAATGNEVSRSIHLAQALGRTGLVVRELHRTGSSVRLHIEPLTVVTMASLLGAIIASSAVAPEVTMWEIDQSPDRPLFRISSEAVTAALTLATTDGTIEMPVSGLPMVLSGLINHDTNATSNIPSVIALAAVNIIGERDRLLPQLEQSDPQASAALLQTMTTTAHAVEAAATIAGPPARDALRAFSRLVLGIRDQADGQPPPVVAACLAPIELAFRSSAPARLPWLDDPPRNPAV